MNPPKTAVKIISSSTTCYPPPVFVTLSSIHTYTHAHTHEPTPAYTYAHTCMHRTHLRFPPRHVVKSLGVVAGARG